MQKMVRLSLFLNVAVLTPICAFLVLDIDRVEKVYGAATEGRAVLLSMYFAILVLSIGSLIRQNLQFIAAILLLQVVYKITTPFTVGTLANPVVISNIFVAVLHIFTLRLMYINVSKAKP